MHAPLKLVPRGWRRGIIDGLSGLEVFVHAAGDELVLDDRLEQLVEVLDGHAHVRRQQAVGGVGELVDVVADAAELGEQRRMQYGVVRGDDLELALRDQALAQTRHREARRSGLHSQTGVSLFGHADQYLAGPGSRRVRTRSRHECLQ